MGGRALCLAGQAEAPRLQDSDHRCSAMAAWAGSWLPEQPLLTTGKCLCLLVPNFELKGVNGMSIDKVVKTDLGALWVLSDDDGDIQK